MNAETTLKKIMSTLGMTTMSEETPKEQVEVKFAEAKLEDGTMIEANEFVVGEAVFVITEEEKMAMPEGQYKLEDGQVIVVDDMGVITEIMAAGEEEAPQAEKVEEVEAANEEHTAPKKVVESETISRETFFAEMEKLRTEFAEQISTLKAENEALSTEKEKVEVELSEVKEAMANEPATKPINHSPEGRQTMSSKIRYANQRPNSTLDRVMSKMWGS
jgi:hypothetical protein